jgi:hypothetical protein
MASSSLLSLLLASVLLSGPGPDGAAPPAEPDGPGPDSTLRGVVWAPPAADGPALRTLDRMAARGVTALRLTRLPSSEAVLSRADSLGLRLFVDLPVAFVSGPALRDSLRAAGPSLRRLRRWARRHPSLAAVGLARHADTSVPAACPPLADWTARLHEGPAPLRTYYVTPFPPGTDRCRSATDLVLLDTRGRPAAAARRGADADSTLALGALGTWTQPGAARGLRAPQSPERQARHLERALTTLLDRSRVPAVFVYRWQDRAAPPLSHHYGLHDAQGAPRPAARVVTGLYRGTQRVFAFPAGTAPADAPVGAILTGWALLLLLGGFYARSAFVRQTVARYFAAPGFYRDAIREGREVAPLENTVLLGVLGVALGLVGLLAARLAAPTPAAGLLVEALPPALRGPLATGLRHPLLAGAAVGGLSIGLLGTWGLLLTGAARLTGTFSFAQALMLITWPCWPALLGMGVALVAATAPPVAPELLGLLLLVGGGGTLLAVTGRVLYDYARVTGLAPGWVLLLGLPSPLVVILTATTLLVSRYDLPLALLWHLVSRT